MKDLFFFLTLAFATLSGRAYVTIPSDSSVRVGKLANGLTYYIKHNNFPENHVDFFLAQRVGSLQEEESQRGLAHFLEHMCFNGTKHFPGNSIIDYLESVGVKFGANLNAYTSTDETVYNICNVPSNRREVLDSCFLILSDWSHNLLLREKDIDEERGVIEGEWRQRTRAYNRMLEKAAPRLYQGVAYGERMPIGLMSVVKNFKYKELRDYYRKWYHPSHQAVIVVGDIDPDYAVAKINQLFGKIKNPKNAAPVEPVAVPDNEEIIAVVENDSEQTSTSVRVMFKHDGLSEGDMKTTKFMENEYLKSVVSSMLNSRFGDVVLEQDAPFTKVRVMNRDYFISKTKQALQFIAMSKDGKVDECVRWVAREVSRATRHGFTPGEFKRARLKFEASLDKMYRERDKYSNTSYARDFVRVFEDGEPYPAISTYHRLMKKVVKDITLDRVNEYLNSLIAPGDKNVVLAAFCSGKSEKLPTEQRLVEAFHEGRAEQVTAYVDTLKVEQLLLDVPVKGRIVSELEMPQFDARILTLGNGVKVYLKKTDLNDNEIVIAGSAPGGLSQNYQVALAPSFKAINAVMDASGYGHFSCNELKKVLAGKNVKMKTFVSKTEEGFQGSATPQDIETAFQLLYLKLTSPRKDVQSFNSYLSSCRTRLENQNADPKFEFADSIFSSVFAKHPLGGEHLTIDEIDRVDYDLILETYKDRFCDVSDMNVFIVGNFNIDSMKALVEKYIASLPSVGRVETAKDINYRLFGSTMTREWSRKMENPQDKVYFFWTAPAVFNLKNSLVAKIAGQVMSAKFLKEIREVRGWTYHVDSHCSVVVGQNGQDEPVVFMPLNVTVTAGKAQETCRLIENMMAGVAQLGVDDEQLNKVKQYLVKVHGEDIKDNSYWMVILKNYAKYGMDFNNDYLAVLNGIVKSDVQQFIERLLNNGRQLKLVMTAE